MAKIVSQETAYKLQVFSDRDRWMEYLKAKDAMFAHTHIPMQNRRPGMLSIPV